MSILKKNDEKPILRALLAVGVAAVVLSATTFAESPAKENAESTSEPSSVEDDRIKVLQENTVKSDGSAYGHWGTDPDRYSTWTSHSNRLIPVYTYGITLSKLREQGSLFADKERLLERCGEQAADSFNPKALYFDQTEVYDLQQAAVQAGYRNIILMVFDGMDWQTTRAAAMFKSGRVGYDSGRGTGLAFQDDRRSQTDFGLICTSAFAKGAKFDVNTQRVIRLNEGSHAGFNTELGGRAPWHEPNSSPYLIGKNREVPHVVTDSASSATSLCAGIKTYNGSINVAIDGTQVVPIGRQLQAEKGFKVGVVTSVPVSHATPGAAYANNVSRGDYQDITRDLVGLPSAAHRTDPLPGVDVLIGCGWGEGRGSDGGQGNNFAAGNRYFHEADQDASDIEKGGRYRIATRTAGKSGRAVLMEAAQQAAKNSERLIGFFGTKGGHLPFATADGKYNPTFDIRGAEKYSDADIEENPTLAEMTEAALKVLEPAKNGFWLMIESGDVDWANHANNLDNSIGAVLSGDAAFTKVMDWVDQQQAWDETAVIVTADHGHYLVIDSPETIADAN
jgi:alkaline phosphatase